MKSNLGSLALFGTSADPPTFGHQAILEGLIHFFPKVVTWASDNPMKKHNVSLKNRHRLLQALVNSIDSPKLEVNQDLSSPWTICTIEKANELWPQAELNFVIGSDLTSQIPNWAHAKDVLQKTRICITPRIGWPINHDELNKLSDLGGRIDLLPLEIPRSSSSDIRGHPDLSKIPASILQIVMDQNLYGMRRSH